MKKSYKILLIVSIILVLITSVSLILILGGKDNPPGGGGGGTPPGPGPDDPNPPAPIVTLIGLDIYDEKETFIGGQIINYELNEDIDTSFVKSTAQYSDGTRKDVTNSVVIDTSKYNKAADGTYEIIISYKEDNITAKSFFLAAVGTGQSSGGSNDGGEEEDVFGPGTYEFRADVDLQDVPQGGGIATGTKFVGGYFELAVPAGGSGSFKRANSSTFAIELPKAETGWIEFEVTGTATVTIVVSSTGGSNDSSIAIYDEESALVANNEGITIVSGTTQTTLTYTLVSGTYRILSQAGTTNSNRGVRVYSVKVVQ